jgi:hypothetical protein
MDNNNLLLWAVVAFAIYYFFFMKKETFSDVEQAKSDIAKKIIAFVNKDTTLAQYLEMLSTTENTSYNVLQPEAFYHFKKIANESRLIEHDVAEYMKDFS